MLALPSRSILPRTKVGLDYGAILGAVERAKAEMPYAPERSEPWPIDWHDRDFPATSPNGAPWLLWHGGRSGALAGKGVGLDADGQWWNHPPIGSWVEVGPPGSGSKVLEAIETVSIDYVVPIVAGVAATSVGGVGGVALAAALQAFRKLAKGTSLTDSVVNSARDAIPSLMATKDFDRVMTAAKTRGAAAVGEILKSDLATSARTAAETAYVVAKSVEVQGKVWQSIAASVPKERAEAVEMARTYGASPLDVAAAFGGDAAGTWADRKIDALGEQYDKEAGVSTPAPDTGPSTTTLIAAGLGLGALAWFLFL